MYSIFPRPVAFSSTGCSNATDSMERYNSGASYIPVEDFTWNRNLVKMGSASKPRNIFHLIGFPYTTSIESSLQEHRDSAKGEYRTFYRLKTYSNDTTRWDSLNLMRLHTLQAGRHHGIQLHIRRIRRRLDLTGAFHPALPFLDQCG